MRKARVSANYMFWSGEKSYVPFFLFIGSEFLD